MARHTPGNYVPLDVNYARDVAIRKAGPTAELLFLRSLAYAKGARTAGFVSDFDLEVVAVGMRSVKIAADKLCEVELWVRVADGWLIRSWERWNATDAAISAGGRLGNHKRWHVDRGEIDPECDLCADRPPIAPRFAPDSPGESPPESQGKGREGKGSVDAAERPDVDQLCEHLHKRITGNGAKATISKSWHTEARRLIDVDKRDLTEAHRLIDWCQDSTFWKANILGIPKFREKYDQLRLQAEGQGALRSGAQQRAELTSAQIDDVLGVEYGWNPGPAPEGYTVDEAYEWDVQQRRQHIQERRQMAQDRMRVAS